DDAAPDLLRLALRGGDRLLPRRGGRRPRLGVRHHRLRLRRHDHRRGRGGAGGAVLPQHRRRAGRGGLHAGRRGARAVHPAPAGGLGAVLARGATPPRPRPPGLHHDPGRVAERCYADRSRGHGQAEKGRPL
ncbi:MAG: RidA/YER057c/UK114 superfamily, group 6, partial [uncultured Acetobacteraceae bacterium]